MADPLWTWLERLQGVRVMVAGDCVADTYLYGQTDRVSREAPVLVVRYEKEETKPGGAANVAVNAAGLGGKVTAVGCLGQDASGKALRRQLRLNRVDWAGVEARGFQTETKVRILAGGFSTARQQVLRIDRRPTGEASARVHSLLLRLFKKQLSGAQASILSDYGGGTLSKAMVQWALAHARKGGLVCVDSRQSLASYVGATVCKPNEPELEALVQMPVATERQVLAAAKKAKQLLKCSLLLLTRGSHGMLLLDASQRAHWIGPHGNREIVDVTGAGDTVLATFSLALAAGAPAATAAALANVAGALVVRKSGAASVTPEEMALAIRTEG